MTLTREQAADQLQARRIDAMTRERQAVHPLTDGRGNQMAIPRLVCMCGHYLILDGNRGVYVCGDETFDRDRAVHTWRLKDTSGALMAWTLVDDLDKRLLETEQAALLTQEPQRVELVQMGWTLLVLPYDTRECTYGLEWRNRAGRKRSDMLTREQALFRLREERELQGVRETVTAPAPERTAAERERMLALINDLGALT